MRRYRLFVCGTKFIKYINLRILNLLVLDLTFHPFPCVFLAWPGPELSLPYSRSLWTSAHDCRVVSECKEPERYNMSSKAIQHFQQVFSLLSFSREKVKGPTAIGSGHSFRLFGLHWGEKGQLTSDRIAGVLLSILDLPLYRIYSQRSTILSFNPQYVIYSASPRESWAHNSIVQWITFMHMWQGFRLWYIFGGKTFYYVVINKRKVALCTPWTHVGLKRCMSTHF